MTGTGTLFSLGNPSKTTVLAEEEDKLRVEFTTNAQVYKGQLLMLDTAGNVGPWTSASLEHTAIGYADSSQASGALVTVVMRGFGMIYAITAAAVITGIGMQTGYDTADTDTTIGAVGYNIWGAAGGQTNCVGWIIDAAAAALALVRVVVKD